MAQTKDTKQNTDKRAMEAQKNQRAMELFISDHRPFIRASASRATGRFITENDDDYMTAMEAFHEAVIKYDPAKGSFTSFAEVVIRRRITDQYRRGRRFAAEISVDRALMDGGPSDHDDEAVPDPIALDVQKRVASDNQEQGRADIKMEIEELEQRLKHYGFSFPDMKNASPRSRKTKEICRETVCLILQEGLMESVHRDRQLPMKQICEKLRISSKKIERHRKYIIAVCEILNGGFPYLSEFLGETRNRLKERTSR